MKKVELNSNGVNKLIKATILSDKKMKEIGFIKNYCEGTEYEEYSPYWWFTKLINFPNEQQWRNIEISFTVKIPKDGSDIEIMILDEDFCQHYPYQEILSRNPKHKCANIVRKEVERYMKYLQDNGVLSGHNYGEYI